MENAMVWKYNRFGFLIEEPNGDEKKRHEIKDVLISLVSRQQEQQLVVVDQFCPQFLHHLHPCRHQQFHHWIIRSILQHRHQQHHYHQVISLNLIFHHLHSHPQLPSVISQRERLIIDKQHRIKFFHPIQPLNLIRILAHHQDIHIPYQQVLHSPLPLHSISFFSLSPIVNCYEDMSFPSSTYTARPPSYHSHHSSDYSPFTSNVMCQSCMYFRMVFLQRNPSFVVHF